MAERLVDLDWVKSDTPAEFDTVTGGMTVGRYAYMNGKNNRDGYLVNDPDSPFAGDAKWVETLDTSRLVRVGITGRLCFNVFELPDGRLVRLSTTRNLYDALAARNAERPGKRVWWDDVLKTWRDA